MTDFPRQYTRMDALVEVLDEGLRAVFGNPIQERPYPGAGPDAPDQPGRAESAEMMRVNHTGEVCAQALYQAQALTARSARVRHAMQQAAREENDHLAWCARRLEELDAHQSYLNPVWYAGSFGIGAVFGLLGDKWNLGFLAETERQVVRHLDRHLDRIHPGDHNSRAVIEQMRLDESQHATSALAAGGRELPGPVRDLMRAASRIMTAVAAKI